MDWFPAVLYANSILLFAWVVFLAWNTTVLVARRYFTGTPLESMEFPGGWDDARFAVERVRKGLRLVGRADLAIVILCALAAIASAVAACLHLGRIGGAMSSEWVLSALPYAVLAASLYALLTIAGRTRRLLASSALRAVLFGGEDSWKRVWRWNEESARFERVDDSALPEPPRPLVVLVLGAPTLGTAPRGRAHSVMGGVCPAVCVSPAVLRRVRSGPEIRSLRRGRGSVRRLARRGCFRQRLVLQLHGLGGRRRRDGVYLPEVRFATRRSPRGSRARLHGP